MWQIVAILRSDRKFAYKEIEETFLTEDLLAFAPGLLSKTKREWGEM